MATRTYTPSLVPFASGINTEQLAALIDTALSRTGDLVTYVMLDGVLTISVTHPSLTAADDTAINAVFAAYVFDPNFQTAAEVAAHRSSALAQFGSLDGLADLLRAEAAVLVDELNVLREWTVSFKAAVAAATSLANLQTRVAALPDLPDRTLAQAKTAIQTKITSGAVDTP